jgi:thiol-disulfide isomerase/thioredoxin
MDKCAKLRYTKHILFAIAILSVLLLFGCTGASGTFQKKADAKVCTQDGKPVIRMYSTSWCPHCQWVKPIFDSVAKEYVDQNKIVAHHWQMDQNEQIGVHLDDFLTPAVEGSIPESEAAVFQEFSLKGSIPLFVFGCEYYRAGNGYEATNDTNAEANEFRKIIDELIAESKK